MGACTSKDRQTLPSTHVGVPPVPGKSPSEFGDDRATYTVPVSKDAGELGTPSTATGAGGDEAEAAREDEVWDDEEEGENSNLGDSKAKNSPTARERRRRLSVSTVEQQAPKEALQTGELKVVIKDADGKKSTRTKVVKFDDPAFELVDRTKGQVKEVTLRMLKGLFPEAEHYAVFGSPSYHIQRGFDNKVQEIGGVMPAGKTLADIGVAFACKKGLKPESPNQDDFFVLRVDDWAMYGVFDGHGPCGHDVSAFIHKTVPFLIISDPQFETDIVATLKRAFWRAHHLVEAAAEQPGSTLDCSLSGTTGTVILQRDGKLYVAHVGDSRAVIAQKKDNKLVAHNLTHDHKPTNPEERARIESSGGEVRRLEGDIPHRVFAVNRMYPGLAMSRAIGDTVGTAVGVTPDPDVRVFEFNNQHKFFMLCSDGVWEFISSQEAVDIVGRKKRSQVQEAAEALAYEAWTRWVEEEENVVDDVTCIIVWPGAPLATASTVGAPPAAAAAALVDEQAAAAAPKSRAHHASASRTRKA